MMVNAVQGTKLMTVDELITTLDSDGDGKVSESEWIKNLSQCVGLAHCLLDHMDANGNLPGFEGYQTHTAKDTAQETPETTGVVVER